MTSAPRISPNDIRPKRSGDVLLGEDWVSPDATVERLAAPGDWRARFDVVVDLLVRRLGRARPPSDLVLWATARIDARAGAVRIDELARELGYSRKHLHACFLRDVGLGPKRYAEVRRFEHLRRRLQAGGPDLADLAVELGYADQAHLARDARRFAGMTTTALQRALTDPLASAAHELTAGVVSAAPA